MMGQNQPSELLIAIARECALHFHEPGQSADVLAIRTEFWEAALSHPKAGAALLKVLQDALDAEIKRRAR